jgi:DNA-directed RNA polymerase specialized sigma24 family protein
MKVSTITQENFDTLLGWLDNNREIAGQKYEKIRRRLIRTFAGRGCFEAEELADETIDRVSIKVSQIIEDYTGEPALYFYGVANKIHHEWLDKQKKIINVEFTETDGIIELETPNYEYECLKECLETLPEDQRLLIVSYYQKDSGEKIAHHRENGHQHQRVTD